MLLLILEFIKRKCYDFDLVFYILNVVYLIIECSYNSKYVIYLYK